MANGIKGFFLFCSKGWTKCLHTLHNFHPRVYTKDRNVLKAFVESIRWEWKKKNKLFTYFFLLFLFTVEIQMVYHEKTFTSRRYVYIKALWKFFLTKKNSQCLLKGILLLLHETYICLIKFYSKTVIRELYVVVDILSTFSRCVFPVDS